MRITLQVISCLALVLTVAPSIMFLNGSVDLDKAKLLMLIATVAWFVVTPLWMNKSKNA